MQAFIKTIGHAGAAVPADWLRERRWCERLETVVFPKYPRSLERGTKLVYYASGTRRFCAVLEVLDDEPRDSGSERWPYELRVRPLVAIPADDNAPTLEEVGINPLSVRRQSHIRIDETQYERIVGAILDAAATATGVRQAGGEGES